MKGIIRSSDGLESKKMAFSKVGYRRLDEAHNHEGKYEAAKYGTFGDAMVQCQDAATLAGEVADLFYENVSAALVT